MTTTTVHTSRKTVTRAGRTFHVIPRTHLPAAIPGARYQPRSWRSYTFAEVVNGVEGPLAIAAMDTIRDVERIIREYVADPESCAFDSKA